MDPFQAPALYMQDVSNSLRGVFVLLTGGKITGEWQQTSVCVCFQELSIKKFTTVVRFKAMLMVNFVTSLQCFLVEFRSAFSLVCCSSVFLPHPTLMQGLIKSQHYPKQVHISQSGVIKQKNCSFARQNPPKPTRQKPVTSKRSTINFLNLQQFLLTSSVIISNMQPILSK